MTSRVVSKITLEVKGFNVLLQWEEKGNAEKCRKKLFRLRIPACLYRALGNFSLPIQIYQKQKVHMSQNEYIEKTLEFKGN